MDGLELGNRPSRTADSIDAGDPAIPRIRPLFGADDHGPALLQMRRVRGWSTGEAARQLGVDRTTWKDWEGGELILYRDHRMKVATLLALDAKELADEMRARWNGKHRLWECDES